MSTGVGTPMHRITRLLLQRLQAVPRLSATVLEEWTRRCLRSLWFSFGFLWFHESPFPPLTLYNWHLRQWVIPGPLSVDNIALQGVPWVFGFCSCKGALLASSYRSQNTSLSRESHKLSKHFQGFAHTFADVPRPPSVNLPNGYCSTQRNPRSTFSSILNCIENKFLSLLQ